MASVLISNLIFVLQQPGLMPRMEEERQQLLQLFTAILPAMMPALGQLICADQGEEEEIRTLVRTLSENSTWLSDLDAAAYEVDDIIDEFRYATLRAGKSILARLICRDARIKDYFEIILWVDVGNEFNIDRIAKSVIDQVIGKDCCLSEGDPDLLQRRIYQELSGKRCLLVLDDVQIEGNFEELQILISWLNQSAAGSSLIVTSNDARRVEKIYAFSSGVHFIRDLTSDHLLHLFCNRAFIDNKEFYLKVCPIIENILTKCEGWILLVNLMAGLMRFKKQLAEWQEVINQLKNYPKEYYPELCFNHLSSEIKECFAFCSVFPKGHYMDKEVLVKLWMANGLISSNGPTSVEEKGNRIFNELAMRHFFEDVKLVPRSSSRDKHGYRSRVICKMHPLIHDLAIHVSRNVQTVSSRYNQNPEIRVLFILGDSPVDIPVLLKNYPNVRTLISLDVLFERTVNCSVVPESNSLRALHLHSAKFDRDLFEVKYTKHLRYLDLSGSRIKRLPESTSSLYFLQTLNLSKCLLLCRLPEDMRYMRSLRHLYVDECPKLKKMPVHLGQLSCLKTLTTYIVGESAGNNIDELKCLNLSGLLEIYNLRKVKDVTIAKEANLLSKKNLERLTLCWGRQQLVIPKENNDWEVLEALLPHNGLKVLKIQLYGGHEFANWLAYPVGLQNLVELHLIGCSQSSTIPAVWKLQSLRVLCLKYMINLTCFSSFTSFPDIDEKDSSELFPSLKRLVLVGLKRLKTWREGEAMQRTILSFPVLDEMEITNCPKLKTMPSVPMLKYLTISIENHGLLRSAIDLITQSKSLVDVNMAKATGSDNEAWSALGAEVEGCNSHKLRVMRLDSTNSLFMDRAILHLQLGFWRSLVSLEYLDIFNCSSIVAWPLEEFRKLNKLKRLSVRKCPNLTGSLPSELQEGEKLLPIPRIL
ncbi:disease resistance protein RGA2-like protein [Carex littledalei]|uniref:Disease resistance protein RGA2-like protein n=1 Tax=Carex littledalei TaxID=544730 RepID=A0A833R053_9POAL|nr:disease resistance protein RGA2-like protein [Carex littledalei]